MLTALQSRPASKYAVCHLGEPNGFSMDDSKACLENLAVLHAEFWKAPFFSEPNDNVIKPSIWKHGGYWYVIALSLHF
jgi:hypothetical protein